MAASLELWYIRLPDGRILRARGSDQLRRILKTGRIPWESRVRRSTDAPWQTLDRTAEFADLVPADSVITGESPADEPAANSKPRPAAPELRTLGVRGLIEELYNAFDSSLQRAKLSAAASTGLGIGVALVIGDVAIQQLPPDWKWAGYLGAALLLLFLFNLCTSILTQMTALELSRFRPALFSEVRGGILPYALRLTFANGLVGGAILGLIVLVRMLPGWLVSNDGAAPGLPLETLLNVINGFRVLLEILCWPILCYAMLMMGPIYVVEDYSILRGLQAWIGILKQHIGRIYLYQGIAFAFAAVLMVPLVLPLSLGFGFAGGNLRTLSIGESVPFCLLVGVALTPMLSYLLVAHVFIYLNLRYEFYYSSRER
jgi:hypothetical protein